MSGRHRPADLVGRAVFDVRGHRIGPLVSVYADADSDATLFGGVRVRVHGRRRVVFVSLVDATIKATSLTVKCGKDYARSAPSVPVGASLEADAEPSLFAHYDIAYRPAGRTGRRLSPRS